MKRSRQLDGLRGIAVALVAFHHWTVAAGYSINVAIGVHLFFVLSGFLITGILLDLRAARETGATDLLGALVTFWDRRGRRILPVFMVTLLLVSLAGERFVSRGDLAWHSLFASNLLYFHLGGFRSILSHFWTLAVVLQFYLIWPFVVMLLPRRRLEAAIVALAVLAPVSRVALYAAGYHQFAQYNVLPFANFDTLGMGALVALWMRIPQTVARRRWNLLSITAAVATALFVASRLLAPLPADIEQSFYAIAFAWLVAATRNGIPGIAGRVLDWRPRAGLGIVSYGVYVYHTFAPRTVAALLRALGEPEALQTGAPLFILSAALTLAVACLSWFVLEQPLNAGINWKRRVRFNPT